MGSNWLEKSLAALPREMRDWPQWKRDAASSDPHLALGSSNEQARARVGDADAARVDKPNE